MAAPKRTYALTEVMLALHPQPSPLLDHRAVRQLIERLGPINTPPGGARLSSLAPVLTVSPTSG